MLINIAVTVVYFRGNSRKFSIEKTFDPIFFKLFTVCVPSRFYFILPIQLRFPARDYFLLMPYLPIPSWIFRPFLEVIVLVWTILGGRENNNAACYRNPSDSSHFLMGFELLVQYLAYIYIYGDSVVTNLNIARSLKAVIASQNTCQGKKINKTPNEGNSFDEMKTETQGLSHWTKEMKYYLKNFVRFLLYTD